MKKLLYLPILLLTMVVGINNVKADNSNVVHLNNFYSNYLDVASIVSTYSSQINALIDYYNNNYSQYPYYVIYSHTAFIDSRTQDIITLLPTSDNHISCFYASSIDPNCSTYFISNINIGEGIWLNFSYLTGSDRYIYSTSTSEEYRNPAIPKDTLIATSSDFILNNISSTNYDKFIIPSYDNINLNVSYPSFELFVGDIFPTYETLSNNTYNPLTTIDMSNYDYIILSLKDYTSQPFYTTLYSLGSLCFTSVYDYGMKEKKDYFNGYQTQGCTENYSTSTPITISISQSDITNHAVYYIKKLNNQTNIIKVPTSVFDITYIPSGTSDPQVSIGGRSYPVIPYSDLTDTANISTDEGYISGEVCALGDINCQARDMGMDITDLFTHPLELLQSLWSSITSVFVLITTFIGLLPITLQTFLYTAFMLAIILGILKIIL